MKKQSAVQNWNLCSLCSWIRRRATTVALAMAAALASGTVATPSALAQTYRLLHSFTGTDGANPHARLLPDSAGNLYGTTVAGGTYGNGTVFKVNGAGVETVLYSVTGGTDGASPYGGLIRDSAGNLYGTTTYGGNTLCSTLLR